jgi:alpha-beta hydrolase superfamily lysophospholipase
MGHSMGGLTINTYLGLNPKIADRLAGVIYSAPFFGMPEFAKVDVFKKIMAGILANQADEIVVMGGLPIHKICRDKQYTRSIIT